MKKIVVRKLEDIKTSANISANSACPLEPTV
jgi:hypothetical protein